MRDPHIYSLINIPHLANSTASSTGNPLIIVS